MGRKPQGEISIDEQCRITRAEGAATFEITTDKKTYYLTADSIAATEDWVRVLQVTALHFLFFLIQILVWIFSFRFSVLDTVKEFIDRMTDSCLIVYIDTCHKLMKCLI